MSNSLAYGLSFLAAVAVLALQALVDRVAGESGLGFWPWTGAHTVSVLVALALLAGGMLLIHAVESQIERGPFRKYKRLRENLYLVLARWQEDFTDAAAGKRSFSRQFHEERLIYLLRVLAQVFSESLKGAVFQVSIMRPVADGQLEIAFGVRSDGGRMVPYRQGRRFAIGEGYCGAAWQTMAPQSGNGSRRWFVLKDIRYGIKRPEGYRDQRKSYFCAPIAAPREHANDIVGVLSIDSASADDFMRSARTEEYLNRLFTPIVGIIEYHLVAFDRATGPATKKAATT